MNKLMIDSNGKIILNPGGVLFVKLPDDIIPIVAELNNLPSPRISSTSIDITVSGLNVSRFKYSIDGGPYSSIISVGTNISITDLTEGSHIIDVLGQNSAGDWQVIPTSHSWIIDLTPPVAILSNLPTAPSITNSATITVGGDDVISYKYKMDDELSFSVETESSIPIELSDLSYGTHTLYVIGKDTAGNWKTENEATTYTWSVLDSYTKLLLHMDGTGTSFSDSSYYNHSVSSINSAGQSTVQHRFGLSSMLIDSKTKYISMGSHSDYNISSGLWTIDGWIYMTSGYSGDAFCFMTDGVGYPSRWVFDFYQTQVRFFTNSNSVAFTANATLSYNTWHHIAISSDGTTARMFLNGNQIGSRSHFNPAYNGALRIAYQSSANTMTSANKYYIDEVRLSKGIARYVSNFTPPNKQF